jgi:hypothetical protein
MRKLLLLALAAATFAGGPFPDSGPLHAQAAGRARVPAWVAISSDLEGSARFRLARFSGNAPQDVILLTPDADAATLTRAVETLLAARREGGDRAASDALLRVRQPTKGTRVLPWAARVLGDVRAAASRQIPGVGRVRAVQIWLPAQQRAGHTSGSGN